MIKYLFILLFLPSIVFAEIENARDLMEEGKFKEAMEELMPAARSGNADAEELIGIMYAMGLGDLVLDGITKLVEDSLLPILLELICGMVCLLLVEILMLQFLRKKLLKK